MANCKNCGKMIKRAYTWKGEIYGKECWKKIALPEIKAQQQAQWEQEEKEWYAECALLVEAVESTLHMVRSDYKYGVLTDLIRHFKEKGWWSGKQYDLAWKLLNNKQCLYFYEMLHEIGMMDEAEILAKRVSLGTKKVRLEAMKRAIELGLAEEYETGWGYGNYIMDVSELK